MQFEAGKTYSTKSVCDSNCEFTTKVLKRTAKTITFTHPLDGSVKRAKIFEHDGQECFRPLGSYSMAPIIRAAL